MGQKNHPNRKHLLQWKYKLVLMFESSCWPTVFWVSHHSNCILSNNNTSGNVASSKSTLTGSTFYHQIQDSAHVWVFLLSKCAFPLVMVANSWSFSSIQQQREALMINVNISASIWGHLAVLSKSYPVVTQKAFHHAVLYRFRPNNQL